MGSLALATALSILLPTVGAPPKARTATPSERTQVVAAVNSTWKYESSTVPYRTLGLRVQPLRGRPRVFAIRVVSGHPSYATAAVQLIGIDGSQRGRPAVVVLQAVTDKQVANVIGPWAAVTEPALSFPFSCTTATPSAVRALLCPSPWKILGLRQPRETASAPFRVPLIGSNLRAVDWANVTLPGAVCGARDPIRLRHGEAAMYSGGHPWWPAVVVSAGRASYGDLTGDRRDEAAVDVLCSNGGGTADGQLAFSTAIFEAVGDSLRLIGVITPRQPLDPTTPHVPLISSVRLVPGRAIVHEAWYGAKDGTCCSSGRATTVWTYANGRLRPLRTTITQQPSR